MRLLILGGNRFIGASLVNLAIKEGHDVTVLSLDSPPSNNVRWLKADRNNLGDIFKGLYFDAIIDNIAYQQNDVETLIEALKDKTKRYVLTSSVDIYRNREAKYCDEIRDERLYPVLQSDNLSYWRLYLRGKRACEIILRHSPHFEKVIVRPAMAVGIRDTTMLPLGTTISQSLFFPARIIDGKPILLYHNDTRLFNTVYVEDVAKALLLAATHPLAAGQVLNVVGDETWTNEKLVYELSNSIGQKTEILRVYETQLQNSGLFGYRTPYSNLSVHLWPLFSNKRLKKLGWKPTSVKEWGKFLFDSITEKAAKTIAEQRQKEITIRGKLTKGTDLLKGRFNNEAPLSFIGIGTSNGSIEDDLICLSAIKYAVHKGITVIDTAINYRDTHSEIIVGQAIRELTAEGINRDSLYVVSKGGFIPKKLLLCGCLNQKEIEHRHSIRAEYINISLQHSILHTKLETIDAYLLHNPEESLEILGENAFYNNLIKTFSLLEQRVCDGSIGSYGIATWHGLRSPISDKQHIDLNRVINCSKIAAGGESHFSVIELPFSNILQEAATVCSQKSNDCFKSTLKMAEDYNLTVLTSHSINLGIGDAKASLQFIHGHKQVNCALVGMRSHKHIDQTTAMFRSTP